MAGRKKKKTWLIPAAAGAAVILGAAVFADQGVSERKAAQIMEEDTVKETAQKKEDTVIWDGKSYFYNDHLSNFLFLGIDTRGETEGEENQPDAGQADAIFLLSWDRAEHNLNLLSIPRDTMTEIETFSPGGESLGMSQDHISLSYAYGDGKNKSCQLTKEAVSRLLYGIPIQGYCAINMDGIPVLADAVGGVTVTVPNDSLEKAAAAFEEGKEILLTKENAETFVRYRDTTESQSALKRLERQNAFLEAFGEQVKVVFQKNAGIVTELYEALTPYMVTNIGNDQFLKMMEDVNNGASLNRQTIPGEGTQGSSFDEFQVDDGELYQQVLQMFYEEAKQGGPG